MDTGHVCEDGIGLSGRSWMSQEVRDESATLEMSWLSQKWHKT